LTTTSATSRQKTAPRGLSAFSPEAIFVISGISQNAGSVLAKSIFGEVRPATVAWIRISFATFVLLGLSWRHWSPWSRRDGVRTARPWTPSEARATALFGCTIALMNLFFYLAIDRLQLGKGLAIEFIGPIAVAASRTRTRRNAVALGLAALGVCVLSGLEIGNNTEGVVFILLASSMWATYIVLGSRVARQDRGLAGLGVGLVAGSLLIAPVGVVGSAEVFSTPRLLATCCAVGLLTTVIGQGLDQHVLRRIAPRRFAVMLALLPVIATVLAFLTLDERPSPLDLVGIALVLAGVITQQRDELPQLVDEPIQ